MNSLRFLLVGVLVLAGTSGFARAEATAEVRDGAKLFTPDTVAQVNKLLQALQRDFEQDILIETIKELSAEERKNFDAETKNSKKAQVFVNLTEKRAEKHNLHGVYILISEEPRYSQVVVRPTNNSALTSRNCNALRKEFARASSQKDRDQVLEKIARELQEYFQYNLRTDPWLALVLLIGGLLAVWILALVIHARRKEAEEGEQPLGTTTKGKVLPGVLGGMFGSVAGHWLYDQSLQQVDETAPPSPGSVVSQGLPLPLPPGPQLPDPNAAPPPNPPNSLPSGPVI
jgi:TPM domain